MKRLALAAAFAALLASAASAQDAPPPAPAPATPPAPAPAQEKAVKDPSKAVGGRIEEALKGVFSPSAAGRLAARASLEAAIADWAGEAKDDPLRAVKYWRTVLGGTIPAGTRRAGINAEKFTWIEGREATLWVSIPKSYGPKSLCPMVLVVLDRAEDPRRALPAMYGECLKEWIVVAISADPKEAGIDVLKEPWLAALGLRWAAENLRVDRDRVVIDSTGSAANLSLAQGAEWAVQFAGAVLRAPTVSSPLVSNLALGSVLLLLPEPATDGQKKVIEDVRASVPGAVVAPSGKGDPETVQKWLATVPPRRIAGAAGTFSWKTRPQGGEPWAYWLWVFRAADSRKERLVDVRLTRDPAGSVVDLQCDNLAEGILLLNDEVLSLDRDVAIRVNGREVWKGRPERQVRTALYWIGQTGERTLFAPAEIRFTVPVDLQSPKKDGAPPAGPDGAAPPPPPPPPPPAPGSGDGGEDRKPDGKGGGKGEEKGDGKGEGKGEGNDGGKDGGKDGSKGGGQ